MSEKPAEAAQEPDDPPASTIRKWLILGCLAFVVAPTACCGSFFIYGYFYGSEIAFNGMREPLIDSFKNSPLSQTDQAKLATQIDRVGEAWSGGKLTHQQVREIMAEVTETSTLTLAKLQGVNKLAAESHLNESEKVAIDRTISRVASGLSTDAIMKLDVDAALDSATQAEDFRKLKPSLTEAELQQIHTALKTLADDATIADEDFTIEIDAEVKRVVDKHLNDDS